MSTKQVRASNFEWLRIIAMFMIVAHHYTHQGQSGIDFGWDTDMLLVNRILLRIFCNGGGIGNNLFLLIGGYFMVSKYTGAGKVIRLWSTVSFYSLACLIMTMLWSHPVGAKDILAGILPIPMKLYWFASTYFLLLLVANFLNRFVQTVDRKQLGQLIGIMVIIKSVLPMVFIKMEISKFVWFVTVYLIAAYIRLYDNRLFCLPAKLYAWIAFPVLAVQISLSVILEFVKKAIPGIEKNVMYFADTERLFALVVSVSLFLMFKNMDIKHSAFVNKVAASTFAVYLIHNNPLLLRILWLDIFKTNEFVDEPWFILHMIGTILCVYVVCTVIDMLCARTVIPWVTRFYTFLWEKICAAASRIGAYSQRFLAKL